MKKLLLLLFIFPLFISCGDDDEKDKGQQLPQGDIVGAWNMVSATATNIVASDKTIEDAIKKTISEYKDKYTFLKDGKFYYFEDGITVDWSADYKIESNILKLYDSDYSEIYTDLTIVGDNMSFTFDSTDNFKFFYGDKVSKVIVKYNYTKEK